MTQDKAREIAAQCWCDKRTEHLVMIPELAYVFAERLQEALASRDAEIANKELCIESLRSDALSRIARLDSALHDASSIIDSRDAEVENWKRLYTEQLGINAQLDAELAERQRRIAELVEALLKHGRHHSRCGHAGGGFSNKCDCGLDAVLDRHEVKA